MLYGKLKPINIVLGQIPLVEQRLRNYHDLVSRLSDSRVRSTHQGGDSTLDGAQSSVPTPGALGSGPLAEDESSSHQDLPSIPTHIDYASEARLAQPIYEDPNGQTISVSCNFLRGEIELLRKGPVHPLLPTFELCPFFQ